jgi:hypothetical protein
MSSSGQVASCRIYARITEAPDVSLLIRAVAPLVRRRRLLHAGDVGGEEVDAVPVEVASGAVVVLGGSRWLVSFVRGGPGPWTCCSGECRYDAVPLHAG